MSIEIHLWRLTDLILCPSQILVTTWILFNLVLRDTVNLLGIHWSELVLVEEKRIKHDTPSVSSLFEKEEKATVGVIVHLDFVEREAAGDCDLHLAHSTSEVGIHVDLGADDAMENIHELGALLETSFGRFDEFIDIALLPTCCDVGVVKEH